MADIIKSAKKPPTLAWIDPRTPSSNPVPPPPPPGDDAPPAPVDDDGIPYGDAPPPPIEAEEQKKPEGNPNLPYPFNLGPSYDAAVGSFQRFTRFNFLSDEEIAHIKKAGMIDTVIGVHEREMKKHEDLPVDATSVGKNEKTIYERHKEIVDLAEAIKFELNTQGISKSLAAQEAKANGITDKDVIDELQQSTRKQALTQWLGKLTTTIETLDLEEGQRLVESERKQRHPKKEQKPAEPKKEKAAPNNADEPPVQDPEPLPFRRNKVGQLPSAIEDLLKNFQSPEGVAHATLDTAAASKLAAALPKQTEDKSIGIKAPKSIAAI